MTHGTHVQHELRPLTRELRRMIPDVYKGFAALRCTTRRWSTEHRNEDQGADRAGHCDQLGM
jgi:hypothetical protein